ncbi:MAG: hydrogenobyrinic acid a,c-diamide synthase (glutamine-hydrolyzing) [Candidatus Methanomethyliaceae archaeon]|nr:hydrogenobyrinic acid a,c-diamide synthase (glutamine-hydrolyzing) [Candidatus Methanomethyliaceae archaeon]MDW7970407.1 cobyrinate a,c-diamide synthase [Nitrososphaerota archaeon]
MKIPRAIISATSSGSGKTLITSALIRILSKKGLKVQPFKTGPDYIDPMYLSIAASRPCRNLDSWIMDVNTVKRAFLLGCRDADVAIIEGVRGLYEGESPIDDIGSTAHIAKILSSPIILVIDCRGLNRSVVAHILGFKLMDSGLNIAGVILNNIRDELHEEKVRRAIQHYTNVPIIGVLYRLQELQIEMRHLGLVIPRGKEFNSIIERAAEELSKSIDFDKLMEILDNCPEITSEEIITQSFENKIKIALFMDDSFSFYYYENLNLLKEAGAQICFIDSIKDKSLESDIAGAIIGGGYPELFADELEKNHSLRQSLKNKIEDEMPVIGECGGLIYLCKSLRYKNRSYKMVGIFDGEVYFANSPAALSYVELKAIKESPISKPGLRIRGHEFHYSYIEGLSSDFAFEVLRGRGINHKLDGAMVYNTIGIYTHLHYLACPEVPINFISKCKRYIRK